MEDHLLNCPICLDYADNAVETTCCGNVFCEGCISAAGNNCPTCRHENVKYRPSLLARRAIGAVSTDCPFLCGAQITRADVKAHILLCKNRQFTCPDKKCDYIAKKDEIGNHILQKHLDTFIRNMDLLFNPAIPPPMYPGPHQDPIATATNDAGFNARLGETGKYYCGKAGCNSRNCCDGSCGPTNGCNCASCQRCKESEKRHFYRLDLKMKKVPPGYLVNRQGALCRPGTTGKFYCGRRVMQHAANSDGYCGPTNGPQCAGCETVQRHARPGYLYGDVWRAVKP